VLSGGVFQNALLVNKTIIELEKAGFRVYTHSKVPPNDGGYRLGKLSLLFQRNLKFLFP
jgi:hydrogenase maturation protein HypF